jgi:cytochrome b561
MGKERDGIAAAQRIRGNSILRRDEEMKPQGYSLGQIVLHWLIVALLVVSYVSSDAMHIRRGAVATLGTAVHVWFGVAILALMLVRLGLRLVQGAPEVPEGGPDWAARIAKITHWVLYTLLIAVPASGAVSWFLGIRSMGDIHTLLFNLAFAVVGLHVAAALYHQFVLKDGLIARMAQPARG